MHYSPMLLRIADRRFSLSDETSKIRGEGVPVAEIPDEVFAQQMGAPREGFVAELPRVHVGPFDRKDQAGGQAVCEQRRHVSVSAGGVRVDLLKEGRREVGGVPHTQRPVIATSGDARA